MSEPRHDPLPASRTEPRFAPESIEESSLLRQLFFERYFRFAVLGVALACIGAAILLPRMIRSTPPDFLPVVRIRILDKLQAWSLARSAREATARGDLDGAVLAWRSAIANDPGKPVLSRSLVSLLADQPVPSRRFLNVGAGTALWLLRLTDTNRQDLDLVARFFSRYELDQYVALLLRPVQTNLSPVQTREYLKALFNLGFMDSFGETWDRYPTAVTGDADLELYRAAWQAGWGPATTLHAGSQRLRDALQDPATLVLAHRLTLAVAFSRADIAGFEQSLDVLEDQHQDRVADHLRHWRLLLNTGQRARAAELARTFSHPPDSPAAALMMADLLVELGLMEYATEFLQQQVISFDFSPEVWQRQADLLMAQRRWNDLRALAVHVRASERIPPDLHGFAWFLEGIAQLQMANPESARKAFARAVDFPPNDPLLTYRMATWLGQHGQHEPSAALLRRLETEFGGLAEYWLQVVGTAYQNRQFDVMRAAAARGYELATNHPVFINNYAAALLIERTNAPLAVQLTLRQLTMNPGNTGARLNHALALLQNGRLDDAQYELDGLDPNALDAYLRTVLKLGYFELAARRKDSKAALEAYGGIEARFLMPPQERWVAETRQSLLAASKP